MFTMRREARGTRRSSPCGLSLACVFLHPRMDLFNPGDLQCVSEFNLHADDDEIARSDDGHMTDTIEQELQAGNPGIGAQQTPDRVISVRGLVKRYGNDVAVGGIDLDVGRGEIFAFLGPNGAGKTTTVEILEGFRRRNDGEVSVLGVDPAEANGAWRNRVGIVLQQSHPEPGLSVRECLDLYAGYYTSLRDVERRSPSSASRSRPAPLPSISLVASSGASTWPSPWLGTRS